MSLPMVNIKETEDAYFVEMAVPGLRKSDFQINLDNQILSIATEMEEENGQKEIIPAGNSVIPLLNESSPYLRPWTTVRSRPSTMREF